MSFERAISGQIKRMVIEQSADLMRVTIETSDSELSPSATQENATSTSLPTLNVGVMRSKGHLLARRSTSFAMAYMAKHFNISASWLAHEFVRFTNRSVYNYILYRRVMLSRRLMLGEDSLNTIAYQCGFSDYSGFLRTFTKIAGVSPSQYRKNLSQYQQHEL